MSKLVIVARIIWHIISNRNKNITNSDNEANGKTCTCRNKSNCPLDNNCLTNKIVDKVEVETNDDITELYTKVYLVSARQNLSSGRTTIQCHLKNGHTKMIPNFQNVFGV